MSGHSKWATIKHKKGAADKARGKLFAKLIKQEFGVEYHPGHVGWLLGKLGWSCQRPTGRALERDERAIKRWKKQSWPKLKKKPSNKDARLCSLMKAD